MTESIEPAHSLLLNGYSKRIHGLIQTTKSKISLYSTNYALKNEKINNTIKKITDISQPYIERYGQFFNGKFEIAKNYVPNKIDINVLEKFQATREKVLNISDKLLTNAEDQLNGLYHSLALPEDKLIANPESKAIKPRVQSILKKSNLLMVTFLGKIYEELRSKDFNREKILKLLFQLKEKIQGLEQVEDAKILSQMFYEYLIKNWVSPTVELLVNGTKQSKTFIVQLPADMKNVDLKKLIENAKVKFTELKDATFIIYKDKVKVVMSKEGLKEIGFGIFDAAHRKVNDVKNFDYKGLDVKKKSLELLNSGKENSMELYRNVKEGLINKKESIRKQLHERKIKKGLSEKFIEMSNKITEEKNKELQEKIMEEIAMKKEGTKEIAQEKENEEIEEEKISQDQ